MAIASGGLWGMGLTRGSPKLIPAYHTDYIFAVICEEFGVIIGVCIIAFYLVFIIRGRAHRAQCAGPFSTMLVAFGCTTLITLAKLHHHRGRHQTDSAYRHHAAVRELRGQLHDRQHDAAGHPGGRGHTGRRNAGARTSRRWPNEYAKRQSRACSSSSARCL